ncbi:MAG: tyrosine-type recombinase/integrase [Methylocella sp.]
MTRTVRERPLDNRTARDKLRTSGKPYWRAIDIGLHIGYRKGARGGRWVMRRYLGDQDYVVETIGTADDNQDADDREILTFHQAQKKIRELAKTYRTPEPGGAALTVKDAIEAYLQGKRGRDQHLRLTRHVLGDEAKKIAADEIASKPLASLTEAALCAWRNRLPKDLAQATVRRISTDLRAALNAAAKAHRKDLPADLPIIIRHGLASEEPTVDSARDTQVLPDSDIRRLIDAAREVDAKDGWNGDLTRLILVLAATGARFSQAVRMTVADVQDNRLIVPVSRKGQGTKAAARIAVRVGGDVIATLQPAIAGRKGSDVLLLRPHWEAGIGRKLIEGGRAPWQWSSELTGPWARMRELSGLDSSIIPYALRHSSIVRGLRAGLPIRLVAALHDTSVEMIEKHYSAFIVDAMDELAAKAIVPLTSPPISHIRPLVPIKHGA